MDQGMPQDDLEDIDCPSIAELFVFYNPLYFDNLLGNCVVEWSPKKMTRCGGICYPQPGGGCIIRLSEPLLRLRPSWELKNTLIHEMVHAWNIARGIRDGKSGHGPHFHQKANEINTSTKPDAMKPARGYHIQQFHHMKDEVKFYQQHHWKCSDCGKTIMRAMDRKPQMADCRNYRLMVGAPCSDPSCSYHSHLEQCPSGVFVKVKEPEGFADKKKRKKKSEDGPPGGVQRPRKGEDQTRAITDFFTGTGRLPKDGGEAAATAGDAPSPPESKISMDELRRRAGEAALRRMQSGVGVAQPGSASTRDNGGGQCREFGSHREAGPSARKSAQWRKEGGPGNNSDDRGAGGSRSTNHNLAESTSRRGSNFGGVIEGSSKLGSYEEAMPKERSWEPIGEGTRQPGFRGGSRKTHEASHDIYDLDSDSEVVDLLDSSGDEEEEVGSASGGWGTSSREKNE